MNHDKPWKHTQEVVSEVNSIIELNYPNLVRFCLKNDKGCFGPSTLGAQNTDTVRFWVFIVPIT